MLLIKRLKTKEISLERLQRLPEGPVVSAFETKDKGATVVLWTPHKLTRCYLSWNIVVRRVVCGVLYV